MAVKSDRLAAMQHSGVEGLFGIVPIQGSDPDKRILRGG